MPLPELLALYGYKDENQKSDSPVDEDASASEQMEEQESECDPPDQPSRLQTLYDPIPENEQDASRLLRSVSRVSEEEEEDYDYSPDEDEWRKVSFTLECLILSACNLFLVQMCIFHVILSDNNGRQRLPGCNSRWLVSLR